MKTMEITANSEIQSEEKIPEITDISVSSADTFSPRYKHCSTKYLLPIEMTNWEPYLFENKLVISGEVAGSVKTDRICNKRLSSLIFRDDSGLTCCIMGPMKTEIEIPELIRNQFKYLHRIGKSGEKIYKDGLPDNWLKLCEIWKFYLDSTNRKAFDWNFHFDLYKLNPLNDSNYSTNRSSFAKTKIKRKYEKYKNLLFTDSETETTTKRIKNQIPPKLEISRVSVYCQTDDFPGSKDQSLIDDDQTLRSNVTVLSPTKTLKKQEKNKSNQEILKDLTNRFSQNDNSLEFIENIGANSTIIPKQTNCETIHYICSKTLEEISKKTKPQTSETTEKNIEIDIELFSRTTTNDKQQKTVRNCISLDENLTLETVKTVTTDGTYNLRSPKRYIVTNYKKRTRRKTQMSKSLPTTAELSQCRPFSPENQVRSSKRKRKILNYRELLFNRIRVPASELIIDPKLLKKPKKSAKIDEKLYKKCSVLLVRENLQTKQKENKTEHVFKTPLTTVVRKSAKLLPKISSKIQKIPTNSLHMWKFLNKSRKHVPLALLSETSDSDNKKRRILNNKSTKFYGFLSKSSSDSNDKKRRKLFSNDSWMQSDGCLKTLSQNQFQSSNNGRFSLRFDDHNMDSELSDSSVLTSSY